MNAFLAWCADASTHQPKRLLWAATLLTIPLLVVAARLEISTSRTALVSEANPHWQRYMAFAREFGIPEDLVVVVDGDDPDAVHRFMDAAAASLRDAPTDAIQSVFYRIDLNKFEKRGLVYVEDEDLARLQKIVGLEPTRRLLAQRSTGERVAALGALLGEAPNVVGADAGPRQTELMAMTLARLIDAMHSYALSGHEGPLQLLDRNAAMRAAMVGRGARGGIDGEGYFTVRDGKTGVIFVRPRYTRDEMQVVLPFVASVRRACELASQRVPGVEFGLTGIPATQRDEFHAIQQDTLLTSAVALLGVAILFLLFLPALRLLLYALVPVAFGVVWTAAAIQVLFGYVNLMSSVFLVVLIGMGIDFSVHLAARYLEGRRRGSSSDEAVRQAVLRSGRGIVTAAVTSAGAFAAVGWCGFQGIEQLGIAASIGLMLTLFAALTVFPATLAVAGPRIPLRTPRVVGLHGWAMILQRRPVAVAALVLVLSIPVGLAGWHTPFNFSLVDILPEDAESAQLMDRMLNERELSANAVVVAAPSLHEARVVAAKLRAKPTVYRVLDPGMFLPDEQGARLARIEAIRQGFEKPPPPPIDVSLADAVDELETQLEDLTDLAMQQKRQAAARSMENALEKVSEIGERIDDPAVVAGLQRFTDALSQAARDGRQRITDTVAAGPVRPEDLPEPLRRRFVSSAGRYAVYAVPRDSMWDRRALGAFIEEVRAVAPDATGFPETFFENTGLIQRGFMRAALYASIAVLILLGTDLRRARDVLFAVIPVGLGVVWMVGSMRLFGVSYNLANIVGLPLIIGVGIDNGVHLMHRFRESGSMVESVTHTGTAVMLSSLTTMLGFGALALSSHRGLASMGIMMFLGVGACLLMAMTVMPALLALCAVSTTSSTAGACAQHQSP